MKGFGPVILCAIVLLSGCGGGGSTGASNPSPSGNTSISPITGPNHLQVGVKSSNFAYAATVSGNSNTAVTWSVDAPSLATINANTGVATPSAGKTGTVTITAAAQADPSTKTTLKVKVVDWILASAIDVTLVDAVSGAPTELLPFTDSVMDCSWTPDHLGFVCVYFDLNDVSPGNPLLQSQLKLFKTDGTPAGTTQTGTLDLKALGGLQLVASPSFSPDGTKIVFYGSGLVAGNGVWGTFVVDVDGKSAPRFLASDSLAFPTFRYPRFSPDGKTILYPSDFSVWLMNADGSDQHPLVNNALNGIFSPDMSALYYTGSDFTVYKADPDGTNPAPVGMAGDEVTGISPNGKGRVVFSVFPPPSFGLYTENADGSGRKQLPGAGSASW